MINFQTTHLPKENEKKRVPLILHFLEGKKKKRYGRIRDREMKQIIMMRIGREKYVKRKTEM